MIARFLAWLRFRSPALPPAPPTPTPIVLDPRLHAERLEHRELLTLLSAACQRHTGPTLASQGSLLALLVDTCTDPTCQGWGEA